MGADGDDIRPQGRRPEGNLTEALHGVGVENGGGFLMGDFCQPGNVVDCAGFVVYHHNRDENGVFSQGDGELRRGNGAVLPGLEIGDIKALGFQCDNGVEDGVMLYRSGDNVAAALMIFLCNGEYGEIIALSAAGGKKQLLRIAAHGMGHLLPGMLHGLFRSKPQLMHRGGIAPVIREGLHNGRNRLGAGLGGGGVIKIDFQ